MHRLKAWGLSVAVLAGAGTPAATAADPPAEAATAGPPTPWYKRLLGGAKPGAAVRGVAPARPAFSKPLPPDLLAEAVEAEQKAWQRRMDVCTELRRTAGEANDDALARQVDDLERQATTLYNQRTAALGVKRGRATLPAAVLDQKLGTGIAATPLTAPDAPAPADAVRTAQVREVSP